MPSNKHWIELEVLPAGYGDALVVTYGIGDNGATHTIVIDGGPPESEPLAAITARLHELPAIDLLVVTHIDVDHVGGMVKLLADAAIANKVKAAWFNSYRHLERAADWLGGIDGELLTTAILDLGVPWNDGFAGPVDPARGVGGSVLVPPRERGALPRVPLPGAATAILLSPGPKELTKLQPVWGKAVEEAGLVRGKGARREDARHVRAGDWLGATDLHRLAATSTPKDRKAPNGSSIAFILCWGSLRLLLGGDAHAGVLEAGLQRLIEEGDEAVGADGRVHVHACKLPHHGSDANLTTAVVAKLACRDWIVSSNGDRFNHPDDIALARVIDGSPDPVRILGNYCSPRMDAWRALAPPAAHGYELLLPPEDRPGATLRYSE
ncbi:MAG: MBL fold metallo-hydrolase [Ilumatobacteraceae bacterium]